MIKDLTKHERVTFTTNENLVNRSFSSLFFEDLEENHGTFEIREYKEKGNITRPHQCGIAVYQLTKLRIVEFYYHLVDKYLDQRDFKLIQIDTDSVYMAISGTSIHEIVRPELREEYNNGGKAEFLLTSKYHDRTPGLFKAEFQGTRMIALISNCCHAKDVKPQSKLFAKI